jgi:uncharacterized damage-inducible protein DinB
LAALRERWQEEETAVRAYVAGLTEAELNQVVKYTTMSGWPMENILWQILVHLVNHGTQTRSEAALLLTGYGYSESMFQAGCQAVDRANGAAESQAPGGVIRRGTKT